MLYRAASRENSKAARWHCRCDCGNECDVDGINLRNGTVQSCGCKKFESHNMIDEIGHRYGRLTVLAKSDRSDNNHIFWICKCDCGNLCEVKGSNLRGGITQSCGCFNKEQSSKAHRINEIGNHYGRLTVTSYNEEVSKEKGHVYWNCDCSCGGHTVVLGDNLRNGNVQSCGCLKSKGEEQIGILLTQHQILFKKEYSFPDLCSNKGVPLRFDFAIFSDDGSLSHLIEYDGIQHFVPIDYFGGQEEFKTRIENDRKKDDYCKEHGIRLTRIKYNDIIDIEKLR